MATIAPSQGDRARGRAPALVESLPHPAYVTGRRWDVLAWNKAAEEIFAFGRMPEEDRNTLISC